MSDENEYEVDKAVASRDHRFLLDIDDKLVIYFITYRLVKPYEADKARIAYPR